MINNKVINLNNNLNSSTTNNKINNKINNLINNLNTAICKFYPVARRRMLL